MGMGLRFEQDSHLDDGICALGQWDLVKIWAEKWEYDPPPFRTFFRVRFIILAGIMLIATGVINLAVLLQIRKSTSACQGKTLKYP